MFLDYKLIHWKCKEKASNFHELISCVIETLILSRGKQKLEKLPCELFLQGFVISRAFLPVSHKLKRGKFQKYVKIA